MQLTNLELSNKANLVARGESKASSQPAEGNPPEQSVGRGGKGQRNCQEFSPPKKNAFILHWRRGQKAQLGSEISQPLKLKFSLGSQHHNRCWLHGNKSPRLSMLGLQANSTLSDASGCIGIFTQAAPRQLSGLFRGDTKTRGKKRQPRVAATVTCTNNAGRVSCMLALSLTYFQLLRAPMYFSNSEVRGKNCRCCMLSKVLKPGQSTSKRAPQLRFRTNFGYPFPTTDRKGKAALGGVNSFITF